MGIYRIECATSHPQGIAEVGDTFYISVNLCKYDSPFFGQKIDYIINRGWHRPLEKGAVEINPGKNIVAIKVDRAGTFQCNFTFSSEDGEVLTCGAGVVAEAEKLKLYFPKPADYDDFWAKQIELLAKTAPETQIKYSEFDCGLRRGEVTANSAYNSRLHAELFMPENAEAKSLPAVIEFQGAGVRGTGFAGGVMRALDGFINLEVLAHDVSINESPEYYLNLMNNAFLNYWHKGLAGKKVEECYFVEMFLRAKRAVEVVKTLPEWDGKNLIVMGGSQGGWQALAAAALDSAVSGAVIWMCAGANIVEGNWPSREDRENEKPKEAAYKNILPYIDSGYFIENVQIPITFHVGLCDMCCHPGGNIAVYNNARSPHKELHLYSQMGHEENTVIKNQMYAFLKRNLK
ncbi:MAG: acetylxylan esterase [Lentisphaeria bacterium]|nr:acetylxylan esterase [Lentisphaeria bacterium]